MREVRYCEVAHFHFMQARLRLRTAGVRAVLYT